MALLEGKDVQSTDIEVHVLQEIIFWETAEKASLTSNLEICPADKLSVQGPLHSWLYGGQVTQPGRGTVYTSQQQGTARECAQPPQHSQSPTAVWRQDSWLR